SEMRRFLAGGGCVCPNRNPPHRAWPYAAQPSGPRARSPTPRQPIGLLPQPMASAIGCHIAITTGESTRLRVEPTTSLPLLILDSALPSLMNAADAGLMM